MAKKPIKEFECGNMYGAVFANDGKYGTYATVRLRKFYVKNGLPQNDIITYNMREHLKMMAIMQAINQYMVTNKNVRKFKNKNNGSIISILHEDRLMKSMDTI